MKPAILRPQARQDRRDEVRTYRGEGGARVAQRLVDNLQDDLQNLERQPLMGSPVLGKVLGIAGLRTWGVTGFPLVLVYIEGPLHLDIVRLLGQRQDIATLLGGEI